MFGVNILNNQFYTKFSLDIFASFLHNINIFVSVLQINIINAIVTIYSRTLINLKNFWSSYTKFTAFIIR